MFWNLTFRDLTWPWLHLGILISKWVECVLLSIIKAFFVQNHVKTCVVQHFCIMQYANMVTFWDVTSDLDLTNTDTYLPQELKTFVLTTKHLFIANEVHNLLGLVALAADVHPYPDFNIWPWFDLDLDLKLKVQHMFLSSARWDLLNGVSFFPFGRLVREIRRRV